MACKVMKRIIKENIVDHLNEHDIMTLLRAVNMGLPEVVRV